MSDVTLTDTQWAVVKQIVEWYRFGSAQVFYLAGYAGTGKSTILKQVLRELKRHGLKTHCLMTFTGKAASVLVKKGSTTATTAHAGMYVLDEDDDGDGEGSDGQFGTAGPAPFMLEAEPATPPEPRMRRSNDDPVFRLNHFGPAAEADLLVFDECSMIDDDMGRDALSFRKKVLVLGDPGQLPPVRGEGAGFFTKMEPDAMLTEVHRQALESPILRLATLARLGEPVPFGSVDAGESGMASVLPLNRRNEHLVYREDTQPICGVHRVRKVVTAKIRHSRGFGGTEPMAGERIICGKNNRERRLFNGLQGDLVTAPTPYERRAGDDMSYSRLVQLGVKMDDHHDGMADVLVDPWMFEDHFAVVEKPRARKNIEWFDWGFVLTCHKAQGSEWPDVTVIDDSGSFREDKHRWLYTAITRASERLTILRR